MALALLADAAILSFIPWADAWCTMCGRHFNRQRDDTQDSASKKIYPKPRVLLYYRRFYHFRFAGTTLASLASSSAEKLYH